MLAMPFIMLSQRVMRKFILKNVVLLSSEIVNLLEHISGLESNNVTLSEEDLKCPVLQIGVYSTLAMPAAEAFGLR